MNSSYIVIARRRSRHGNPEAFGLGVLDGFAVLAMTEKGGLVL